MDTASPAILRTGKILVGALIMGMLSFSAVAAVMARKVGGPTDPSLATTLFICLGVLAISELMAYQLFIRPLFVRQTRAQAAERDHASRPLFIQQRFLNLTIIAAALAEGVGLFGAVIVLVTGRLEALAAPGIATLALLLAIPTTDRLEAFTRQVGNDQPFPR